ncbi:MAG TPA: FHA domain-containing protein [Sedimentisphaerales bacterium]|nr:FHA domain-containing protein [Sedimentisphaerales bacterium]
MRLIVKKDGHTVNDFRFERGPVYIGRHEHSQIFLPDRAVSRQHAAIFATQDGTWVLEDLDSANKTFLNDKAIHKAPIKTGDRIRVGDFEIEVTLDGVAGKPIHLEDTLMPAPRESSPASAAPAREIIVRKPDAERAPDINLPAMRVKDFLQATEAICKSNGPDEVLKTLLNITLTQFRAHNSWCALRALPEGPMTVHAGKSRDGGVLELTEIKVHKKISQAIEKQEFLLLPRVPSQEANAYSAMIAPIIDPSGCFGVLYVDNAGEKQYYTLSDLDYLMLLAIHTAAIVENF